MVVRPAAGSPGGSSLVPAQSSTWQETRERGAGSPEPGGMAGCSYGGWLNSEGKRDKISVFTTGITREEI